MEFSKYNWAQEPIKLIKKFDKKIWWAPAGLRSQTIWPEMFIFGK